MIRNVLATIMLWVLACAPALADYAASRAWFEGLGDERFQVQADLILAGFYNGFIDGEFGRATYKALTDFEETRLVVPDGVLEENDRDRLYSLAYDSYHRLGFERWVDERARIEIWVPRALLSREAPEDYGTFFSSDTGSYVLFTLFQPTRGGDALQDAYAQMLNPIPGRTVTYQHIDERVALVAAQSESEDGDTQYEYSFTLKVPGGAAGFVFVWGEQDQQTGAIVAAYMASNIWGLTPVQDPAPARNPEPPPDPRDEINTNADLRRFGSFYVDRNDPKTAVLSGLITPGSALDFRRLIAAFPEVETLVLDSQGGSVNTALLLAYEIHESGYQTQVPEGAECFSACAFLFFAGAPRIATGDLGVHQIWAEVDDNQVIQRTVSDILEAMETFGVDQRVISAMLRTGPDEMYVFTRAELRDWGIVRLVTDQPPDAPPPRISAPEPATYREEALLVQEVAPGVTGAVPVEGVVDWHLQPPRTDGPLFTADVRFPGGHFEMIVSFHENTDADLSASHVFDIAFQTTPGFPGRGIAGVGGILAKSDRLVPGTPLIGAPIRTSASGYQFYMSSQADDLLANFTLLPEQDYLDIAIIYEDGRRALVTLKMNDAVRARLAILGGVSSRPASR